MFIQICLKYVNSLLKYPQGCIISVYKEPKIPEKTTFQGHADFPSLPTLTSAGRGLIFVVACTKRLALCPRLDKRLLCRLIVVVYHGYSLYEPPKS